MNLKRLVELAIEEDIGPGDLTTNACIPADSTSKGWIEARERLVVSGLEPAAELFRQMGVTFRPLVADGTVVERKERVAEIEGPSRAILTGERIALNFLMKLSGIATNTAGIVSGADGRFAVVDTRKTTPLLRALEKAAVRHGGGVNHRFALYDGVMVKDNHIVACGGIEGAVRRCREGVHHLIKIEVEVDRVDQIEEALAAGADVLLLDNMSNDELREAVELVAGRAWTEASGNMTRERLEGLREVGIDCVSVGGLIHQATWVDLALELES